MEKYPMPEQVRAEIKKVAPVGWIISYEYPDFIGVNHPTFTNDQFILVGDVNEHYGFNDHPADVVCGSMEGLTDAADIAASFWLQVGKFYPDLVKGE